MVTPRDHAKVLDLGLALMDGEVGELEVVGGKGYVVGSMDYIAPEQTPRRHPGRRPHATSTPWAARSTSPSPARPPFPGGTTKEKIHAHRHQEPPPLQLRNKAVPDDFATLVHLMLAKNPDDRLQDMSRIRDALDPWRKPEEVQPLDEEGDPNYLSALAEIEKSSPTNPSPTSPSSRQSQPRLRPRFPALALPPPHPDLLRFAELDRRLAELRRIAFVVAGLCAFLLLLLAILLFLVVR